MQVLFGHFADAGNFPHFERRKKARFLARQHPQDAVRLGLVGSDLGDQAGSGDPYRAVEPGAGLHRLMQGMRGGERRAEQAPGAGHIEISFVDRRHFDQGREALKDFPRAL